MPANNLRSDKIWIDGAMVPYDEANVHVLTHSLHYGLAVFEGMRCYKSDDGRSAIFRAHEHIRRLIDSAHIVEMPKSPTARRNSQGLRRCRAHQQVRRMLHPAAGVLWRR